MTVRARSFETALCTKKDFFAKAKPFEGPKYPAHVCCATPDDGPSTPYLIAYNARMTPRVRTYYHPRASQTYTGRQNIFGKTVLTSAEQLDVPALRARLFTL